jgi:hypothetical protein
VPLSALCRAPALFTGSSESYRLLVKGTTGAHTAAAVINSSSSYDCGPPVYPVSALMAAPESGLCVLDHSLWENHIVEVRALFIELAAHVFSSASITV